MLIEVTGAIIKWVYFISVGEGLATPNPYSRGMALPCPTIETFNSFETYPN